MNRRRRKNWVWKILGEIATIVTLITFAYLIYGTWEKYQGPKEIRIYQGQTLPIYDGASFIITVQRIDTNGNEKKITGFISNGDVELSLISESQGVSKNIGGYTVQILEITENYTIFRVLR